MKRALILVMIIFAGLTGNRLAAQDCATTNPKYCKVLCDTAGVKMTLVTLPAGARLEKHTHPVNFGYCIQGGLFKWTYDNGKTESVDMKPGDEYHGGPEPPHVSWNAGKTTLQFLMIEKHD